MPRSDKKTSDWLAWIDIETTGLDVEKDVILEIALVVTDGRICSRHVGPNLLIRQEANYLDLLSDFTRDMHTKSGLLEELEVTSIPIEKVEAKCLEFLGIYDEPGKVPLAGSSVGFDRKFLEKYMPTLAAWFHYRNADISALQEFMIRWNDSVYQASPEPVDTHRAFDDIMVSINKAAYYRNFFKSLELVKT